MHALTTRLVILSMLLVLAVGTRAGAQTSGPAVPTTVTLMAIAATGDPLTVPGIGTPVTTAISATAAICNLPVTAPATGVPINPTRFGVDDPFNAGRECRVPGPVNLPEGTYRLVATYAGTGCTGGACVSGRSVVALPGPFTVVNQILPPLAPTGLRILP